MARARGEGAVAKRTVKRKNGPSYVRFYAVLSLGYDENGKRIRLEGPWREKKAQAAKDLSELREDAAKRQPGSKQTLATYLDYWLQARRELDDLKIKSYEAYESDIRLHLKPRLGDLILDELKPIELQNVLNDISRDKSPFVARKCRLLMSAALEQAFRWELVTRNVAQLTKAIPNPRNENADYWTMADLTRLFDAAKDEPLYVMLYFSLMTGLRKGEFLALRWEDLKGRSVFVQRTMIHAKTSQGWQTKYNKPKTKAGRRRVPLPSDVYDLLMGLKEQQALDRVRFGDAYEDHGLIFCTSLGTPYAMRVVNASLTRILGKARATYRAELVATGHDALVKKLDEGEIMPHLRVHDLRHLNASLLIRLGKLDALRLSQRLGHSQPSTTFDRYGHMIEEMMMSEEEEEAALQTYTLGEILEELKKVKS